MSSAGLLDVDFHATGVRPSFDRLVMHVSREFGCEIALVSIADEANLTFIARQGTEVERAPRESSLCHHVIESKDALLLDDASEDERFANFPLVLGGGKVRSYAGCPITNSAGEVIGTLCVIDSARAKFSKETAKVLQRYASAVSDILRLHELFVRSESLARQLQDTNERLRLSNRVFEQAESVAKIGCWELEIETEDLYWSDEVYRMHGLPLGIKMTVETAISFYLESDRRMVAAKVAKALAEDGAFEFEATLRSAQGELRRVHSTGEVQKGNEQQPARLVGVIRDITEKVQTHEEMARMGRILDNASNEIFVFDAETLKFSWINRGARENLGYSEHQLAELTPVDIKPEFDEVRFRELVKPLVDGSRDLLSFETHHQRADGTHYPVSINLSLTNDQVTPSFVAMVKDITEERSNARRIEELAFHDQLTGLPNRALLMDRLAQALCKAERNGSMVHILFMDLNRFKEINDTRGHRIGDAVLVEVASRLRSVLRGDETLARLGGDEFVVVLEQVSLSEAVQVIERLNRVFESTVSIDGKSHSLSASIGSATFPYDSKDGEELIQLADIAMYSAKSKGGDYCLYDAEMGQKIARDLELSDRLRSAISEGNLEVHFQPIIDTRTGKVIRAEALVRWCDPDLGWVAPTTFIPIAEKRRMMTALGNWVIDRTCAQIAEWQGNGYELLSRIAINIASEQLETDDLITVLGDACARHGIAATSLGVEITESSMMTDPETAIRRVQELRSLGVTISIDDFGTGYSSLAYLKQFAVDKLKIDMSFVHDIIDDKHSLAIVSSTIKMAHGLGLKVVAEGVETASQALKLRQLHCDEVQGFHYGSALPPKEFAEMWLGRSGAVHGKRLAGLKTG